MNVKFTQKLLIVIFIVLGVVRTFDFVSDISLILILVFGIGAYISLIISELQDRISKIEENLNKQNPDNI